MLLKETGEFGLIDRISRLLPDTPPNVVVGIGDDVAVLRTSGPDYLLATCDAQVEGVHFTRGAISPYQLGRRAIAINVSDIAAMGGNPLWALVSLAMPDTMEVGFIEELYRGMREQARLAGAVIVGGNISRISSGLVIDITLLGQTAPEKLVLRSGAREGDAVIVTGYPGESRAGLELLRRTDLKVTGRARAKTLERHLTPQPRLREGQILAGSGLVHAMADVSDGVLADLGHICKASHVGAVVEIDNLPVSNAAGEVCAASGGRLLEWVLSGGEDYELLFSAEPGAVPRIRKLLSDATGLRCSRIGTITRDAGAVRIIHKDGSEAALAKDRRGWDHFGRE